LQLHIGIAAAEDADDAIEEAADAKPFGPQQRLFYMLEALGLGPTLHRKVFQTIHVERTRLRSAEGLAAFALKNGVDPIAFMTTFNSFGVQTSEPTSISA
jgi:thiol:disulfide interchange protein DsbA